MGLGTTLVEMVGRPAPLLLDGGSGSTLQDYGYRMHPSLWAAGALIDSPDTVRKVHRSFLEAGADVISTIGYQASLQAFVREGLAVEEAESLIALAVELAVSERDRFEGEASRGDHRLVAASIGPYGAYLHNGAEYRGHYGLTERELTAFHDRQFAVLAGSDADLLALETIPSLTETRALCRLLAGSPAVRAWISFVCRDGAKLCDGTLIERAVDVCEGVDGLVALGVNCTHLALVDELIQRIRSCSDLPVIVYPNLESHQNDSYSLASPKLARELADPTLGRELAKPQPDRELASPELEEQLANPQLDEELSDPQLGRELANPQLNRELEHGRAPAAHGPRTLKAPPDTGGPEMRPTDGRAPGGCAISERVSGWVEAGAVAVGGCCGVGPSELRMIATAMGRI